jgi:uncharacterized protein
VASSPDNTARDRAPGLGDEQIADYLRRHPDFLLRYPELLAVLAPPSRDDGNGVVDMQSFMIERLRAEVERLTERHHDLLDAGRKTLNRQGQVHDAVTALLSATTLEHLVEVITSDLPRLLNVDVVALCVEDRGDAGRRCGPNGITCLDGGAIDHVLGAGRDLQAGDDHGLTDDERIFGAGTGLVRSAALARLTLGGTAPTALLALGSRRPDRFPAGQGGEPLGFLARVLEHCLRAWLGLPT